jgi:RNA polymerase sigma factor (sigma-70 family)
MVVAKRRSVVVAEPKITSVLKQLQHVVMRRYDGGLSDVELLERFVVARDPAAFEVLIWRHGSMVFGICRRMLGNFHDAEDALQATFLALSRQAGSIGKRASLAGWLCKVAYRIALRARTRAAKHATTSVVDEVPAQAAIDPGLAEDVRLALEEELHRLPEKYRAALVLYYWSGLTNREIAGVLDCPIGTVSTRMARGRALLRSRLARRGVTVAGTALVAWFEQPAMATLPLTLVQETVRAGLLFATGRGAVAGTISPGTLALAEGVLKMTMVNKLKVIAAVLLVLVGLGAGAVWFAPANLAEAQTQSSAAASPERAKGPEQLPQASKDDLRYGGKTFDDWAKVLTTDLKPEVRAEAIKALGAFGANGHAQQAANAITLAMRGYNLTGLDPDDEKVIHAALGAVAKIGSPTIPVLLEELKEGKANGRRFALAALLKLAPDSKAVALAVADHLKDKEPDIRNQALQTLSNIDSKGHSVPAIGEALVKDTGLRRQAIEVLEVFGEKAKAALPQLLQSVKEFPEIRFSALKVLRKIDPDAKTVMPVLVIALKDKRRNTREGAIEYLVHLGPEAQDAVQPLMEAWKKASEDGEKIMITGAFASIGPAAKEAVPLLLQALGNEDNAGGNRPPPGQRGPSGGPPGMPGVAYGLPSAIRAALRLINP